MANKLGLAVLLGMSCNFPTLSALGTDGGPGGVDSPRADSSLPIDSNQTMGSCDPGAMTCTGSTLSVCNAGGSSSTMTACALGCEDGGSACKTFTPSNGLATALGISSGEPDIVFPTNVTINTDTGAIVDGSNGASITVASLTITQTGAGIRSMRAFMAHSFDFTNAVVTGTSPAAFVSATAITIHGYVDASANGQAAGPGALESPSTSTGITDGVADSGGGGGANATAGGSGTEAVAGGAAQTGFTPLAGGGRGGVGDVALGSGSGGGGGGAVQLVAADSISISGIVDVGGGGGIGADGGGGGGTLLVEAPSIDVEGIVAANGGGGGGGPSCGSPAGVDGLASASVAAGGGCSVILIVVISRPFAQPEDGGSGGTGSSAPLPGAGINAGGGGAAGRIEFNTADGSFTQGADAIVSGATTTGALAVH